MKEAVCSAFFVKSVQKFRLFSIVACTLWRAVAISSAKANCRDATRSKEDR